MTARPIVSLARQKNYQPEAVLDATRRLLEPFGGMKRFVKPGARVLLKPNLVFGRHPDKAINPHPAVVRAVAILAREAGAGWLGIGDSPGLGTARAAARAAGLAPMMAETGAEAVEFTPIEHIDRARAFVKLELAREVLEADVVINLPKMKTHGQMRMSLAVKNMFGAVPGARKLQWHYRAGRDRLLFARAINEIALATKPALSVLDAVVGMDGLGPTAGHPRQVGFLAASADPWALDAIVMDILGLERTDLYTLTAAERDGPAGWRNAVAVGEEPSALRPGEWLIPEMVTLQMHGTFIESRLPGLAKWLRTRISPRPEPKASCIACGHCVEICPAKAMRMDGGKVKIDDAACIRCYCCHELCQHDGMDMRSGGLLAKLLGIR